MSLLNTFRDTIYAVTSCCFPNPTIRINKRTFKVIRLLGEGGFSFVYLVQDVLTGRLVALKKIRCPLGSEAVADAVREIDMYRMFQHENIIRVLDTSVMTDRDGTKIVYIFLPFYKRGNLQDSINANNLSKTRFQEKQLLQLFRKVCYALRVLHTYTLPKVPMTNPDEEVQTDENFLMSSPVSETSLGSFVLPPENDSTQNRPRDENNRTLGQIVPYAHRDLKPGNILISDDGKSPVLMDFGSITQARVIIKTRQDALLQQDIAGENSTMSYRAPELYDVQTDTELDEKVDIWSLGCTLYAAAYGQSPFEANINEVGGSLALAILNGQFKFPSEDPYSEGFRDCIRSMLTLDPVQRPDIHAVISSIDALLAE
ncbi:hypothetical protein DFQ28_007982 [Apophysomyces sp. BC1034]|nr:hypothetical protein DFQ30_007721 [Apophysomyces sp. BC1015]KAG0175948.1 hypothetical protein DFQ29_006752 [Apophysomyces sp. BC1021]KAG0186347.1 hypothetical protein DFQ28_007982 [Apophysomyces sp. BC1034]